MCLNPENRTKEELAEQILKDTKELIDIAKEMQKNQEEYVYRCKYCEAKLENN